MKFQVRHTTRYSYDENVSHSYNIGYFLPRNTERQRVLTSNVTVLPPASGTARRVDIYGNQTFHFNIEQPHKESDITVVSQLEVFDGDDINLQFGNSCAYSRSLLTTFTDEATLAAREFLLDSPKIKTSDELAALAAPFFTDDKPLLAAAMELTTFIYQNFQYDAEFSDVSTPLSDVVEHKRGVCQDFAHLAIAALRALGYPARYVSGYLETLPPPGQKKLVGADATHAWFAIFSPGEGWFEFDPTNNTMAGVQHITTAWGRDYADVPPLKGVVFGGGESSTLDVAVDVTRLE